MPILVYRPRHDRDTKALFPCAQGLPDFQKGSAIHLSGNIIERHHTVVNLA